MADFFRPGPELYRYFPQPFYKIKPGTKGLAVLIDAFAQQLDEAAFESMNYREQFLLATALGEYLAIQGVNLDVFKVKGYRMADRPYRSYIEIITNTSKNVEHIFERLIRLFFGADAIPALVQISSYRPNVINLWISRKAFILISSRDLYGTWYLHNGGQAFTDQPNVSWDTIVDTPIAKGDLTYTLLSLPTGMPTVGVANFGVRASPDYPQLTTGFTRAGLVMVFDSPINLAVPVGTNMGGSSTPGNYPSGYMYNENIHTTLAAQADAGANQITVRVSDSIDSFPLEGSIYIQEYGGGDFETIGYKRSSLADLTWDLKGTLAHTHISGVQVSVPTMGRRFVTQLAQNVTAGSTYPQLLVVNGADFPKTSEFILRLAFSFDHEELIPIGGKDPLNPNRLFIDPAYDFKYSHAVGTSAQLMAYKLAPTRDGEDWPTYLSDYNNLKQQFYNILNRVKAVGVRLEIEEVP